MKRMLVRSALVASVCGVLHAAGAQAQALEPYPIKGKIVQVLNAFDNPEGAIFSAEGEFVFISNLAELGMHRDCLNFSRILSMVSSALLLCRRRPDFWIESTSIPRSGLDNFCL